jgi:hypothetical protein
LSSRLEGIEELQGTGIKKRYKSEDDFRTIESIKKKITVA